MANKHTPGPWKVGTPGPNGCYTVGTQGGLMTAMIAHSICEPDQIETANANARLIAASPDLLAACQAFSRLYGRLWDVTDPVGSGFLSPESVKDYDAIHRLMTRAIQKATA